MTTRPFPIPVRAFAGEFGPPTGPGSQPPEDDAPDAPAVPPMPRGMSTFEMPRVPERVPAAVMLESATALEAVLAQLDRLDELVHADGTAGPAIGHLGTRRFALDALSPAALEVTHQVLGEGEVSMRLEAVPGQRAVHVQESVFAGLWRCGELDAAGHLARYWLEAGAVPEAVGRAALHRSSRPIAHAAAEPDDKGDSAFAAPDPMPEGTMNAPALLAELRARVARHRAGERGGQIELSLLPLSPADRQVLAQVLPPGPVAVISRGFGNCHIGSTAVPGVWRLQYFNSMNTLILDLVEVTALPEVILASAEDLSDSRQRLAELVQWMKESAAEEALHAAA